MINFRYHLISLVAVFLALAVGIVMGSTVIDKAIVDSLKSRIDTAERNSIERKVENDRLKTEATDLNDQDTALAAHAVKGQLANQNVFLITVGDVSDTARVETLELLSVSGAKVPSVIRFENKFLENGKADILGEVKNLENIRPFLSTVQNKDKQFSVLIQEALAIQAGLENTAALPADSIINFAVEQNILEQQEKISVDAQPISFLVLVQRSAMQNSNTLSFVSHMQSKFPVTLGLVGETTDNPSRSDSIKKLGSFVDSFAIVDNAETPSGRTAFIIGHARNIAGDRQIYGVSDQAKSFAPLFNES